MARAVSHTPGGDRRDIVRDWVPEAPVALEFNGVTYAVMMASPNDLEDFITGFALTEGLALNAGEIADIAIAETEIGWIARASLTGSGAGRIDERVRARVSESSCGLCGIENLEAIAAPLPQVAKHAPIAASAIFEALANLAPLQPLTAETGAAHAAAWASEAGVIGCVREDVGRHNAVDKLVGAMARSGSPLSPGFVLSTARCSYEIVEKSVKAGATSLVTISLPTTMAIERARAAGLSLWVLARQDSVLLVNDASD